MDEEERKKIILQDLAKNGESSITEISRRVGMAQATISKYLRELKADHEVTLRKVPPLKYYKLSE